MTAAPPTSPADRPAAREALSARRALLRRRARRSEQRGVALILVLGAISILTVLLAEFQDEASSESAAAVADRDALRAEYVARSAVNLARLLLATEPTIRSLVGPILSLLIGGNPSQIPVWEFADQMLGAFNDAEGTQSFSALAGVDVTRGKNLGIKGARFNLVIVDEDSKINVNIAARGDAISQLRMETQLLGLMQGDQYNPLFENRDGDGQYSDRATVCGAIIDWADFDEKLDTCTPTNAQNTGSATEDNFYGLLKVPYRRKNAAYDSLDELHLVRGVTDDFFSTFVDPDPSNPKKRVLTVWGQGLINVNTANAQTLLAVVCSAAVATTPLCNDPLVQAKFLTAVNLLRGFTAGAPLFSSAKGFLDAMQGKGPIGKMLSGMLGLDPIVFKSASEATKQISTESKFFSIYADGVVPGYRRKTTVRIHAVVDFTSAPPPGEQPAGITAASSGSAGGSLYPGAPPSVPPSPAGGVSTLGASGSQSADAIAGALAPNPGGSIVYYRIE